MKQEQPQSSPLSTQSQPKRTKTPFSRYLNLLCLLGAFLSLGMGGSDCQYSCLGASPETVSGVTITPTGTTIQAGQSATFVVKETTPDTETAVFLNIDGTPFVTPDRFTVRSSEPDGVTVTVTVPANTVPGPFAISVNGGSPTRILASASFTVVQPNGTPTFTFTASPLIIDTRPTQFSDPVTFTPTSLNGFTGDVSINWEDAEGAVPSDPEPRPFVVNVVPGTPTTFTRRFYRFSETGLDIPITFTATSGEIIRSVTITTRDSRN